MTPTFDLNAALQAPLQQIADIRAAYAAGQPWPPVVAPPVPAVKFSPLASGATINLLGSSWTVQSGTPDGVSIGDDGSVAFKAKTGDRASFDPARKIRAELANGGKIYAKGEPMKMKGAVWIDPTTLIANSDWCSIVQIHPADTRFANGVPVSASPMFSMGLVLKNGKPMIQVLGQTSTGVPAPNTFAAQREFALVPIDFGVEHAFDFTVTDGHGGTGAVHVSLDGKVIVDFTGPTGYEYVDLLASAYLIRGAPQPVGSYLKIGIYAGKGSGDNSPADTFVGYRFKFAS